MNLQEIAKKLKKEIEKELEGKNGESVVKLIIDDNFNDPIIVLEASVKMDEFGASIENVSIYKAYMQFEDFEASVRNISELENLLKN